MNLEYKVLEKVQGDYFGEGLKVICIFQGNEYKLFTFFIGNNMNSESDILMIENELVILLSWIKANYKAIHKKAVTENYNWLFDELINDSDYYLEKGSISTDDLIDFTHLGWIKIFCEKDRIKSFLLCYEETEEINAAILGGHTFGVEIDFKEIINLGD